MPWCKCCGEETGYLSHKAFVGYCDRCSDLIRELSMRMASGGPETALDCRKLLDKAVEWSKGKAE